MGKQKILLADDVELFLELEKTFFRRDCFELLVARDGKEAYQLVELHRPDLVFMDLYMPEMDGDKSCRKIKKHPDLSDVPVIMVTQGGREEDLERCRRSGCDDILLKPINRDLFMETAKKYLGISQRKASRVTARLKVFYGPESEKLLTDYSLNLSTGGLFLETEDPLPVDTPLSLEFFLPVTGSTIKCRAQVAWVNFAEDKLRPNLPTGIGVQFIDLTMEGMNAIREFVKQECLKPIW